MPIRSQPPPEAQQSPYSPTTIEPLLFEKFEGINTSALRVGVPDQMCAWLDGFMPIAPRNLRTLYGVGTTLYTAPGGTTIVFYGFANLGTAPIMVVFLSNGAVIQVNTATTVATTILAAATITSPSILNCGITQWGSQYLIIVANQTNGYWVWDGALVYKAGEISPVITLTNVGSGYTSAPTVTVVGGQGSGTSLVATISGGIVTGVSVVNPGSGYVATDTPTISFFGGNTAGSGASITAIVSSGTVVSLNIVNGGSLYSNHPVLGFVSSGPQSPASAIVTSVVNGTINAASVTFPGFYSANAATVTITDTAVTAAATLQLMPFGVQGTCAETYQGRVWVGKVATIFFTAPGSVSDFSTSSGGGNFTSRDSFLQIGFTELISSNGFLYLIADSSINYISGVQTSGSPPTTTFTNQNADPQVGSPYPASVETYGRQVLFANDFGIHVVNGAQVAKVSEMLDGVYNTVASFGGLQLASSQATIFGKKVWMTLVRIVDPVSGSTVNKLFMWNGKQWWASSQDMTLIFVKHQEINSVLTAWGTDGTVIKPLFNTASVAFEKIAQSRLWDAPGGYQFQKATSRLWTMAYYYSTSTPNLKVGIDNESGLMASLYTLTPSATGYFISSPQAVGQVGVLLGLTFRTNAADMALVSGMVEPGIVQYRG